MPLRLTELVLLAILWAAVVLVEEGFGSLARGLLTALVKSIEDLPTRLAVGVLAFPPAPTTLPPPLPTFLARGLTPRMVEGSSGNGRRGLVEETFGGDMVGLTENQICPSLRGPEGVTG